jgi:DNA topoisomerase VI subunit A
VADVTTYTNRFYDPYSYYPYSYYPYGYNRYGYSPGSYATDEMKQYLIDFETGKILEYTEKNVEILLMKDPELHDEYASLKKKKQKQLKFLYIRKFNEKNPVYFPVSK